MEKYETELVMSNLRSYLESHNIDTSKLFHCINPNHRDSNASMKYFDDNRVYCFGCGANYNLVDVMAIMEGVDNKQAFRKAMQTYGNTTINVNTKEKNAKTEQKNYKKAFKVWQTQLKDENAKQYLKSRCISDKTAKKFELGYNTFDFGKYKFSAIIIPMNDNCFTARNVTSNKNEIRYYKPKGCHTDLFNVDALTNDIPYCFITEGEFDCMSFDSVEINALALSGANNVSKFIARDKNLEKTYILALDNDEAGQLAKQNLIDYFKDNNIKYLEFDNCGYKDANQALVASKDEFIKHINEVLEQLDKESYRKLKKLQNAEM